MHSFFPGTETGAKDKKRPVRLVSYLVLLNLIICAAGLLLHELGHLASGSWIGCSGGGIAAGDMLNLTVPGVFTALICPAPVGHGMAAFLGLSGFLFIVPFALAFMALKQRPEKNFAYVLLGFSVVLAGLDLLLVLPFSFVVYAALAGGVAVLCIGEVFLVGDYMDYLKHSKTAKRASRDVSGQ